MSEKTNVVDDEPGIIAYLFSNDPKQAGTLLPTIRMFYNGVYENTVGIMEARNDVTEEIEIVLVGVKHEEDGSTTVVPLAKILTAEEAGDLSCPDSQGGWINTKEQWAESDEKLH